MSATPACARRSLPRLRESGPPKAQRSSCPICGSTTPTRARAPWTPFARCRTRVRPYLPGLLADPDPDVRLLACDLVRDAGGAEGPRWLCALIETEPQANVCAAAVEALGEIGDATAAPSLSRCAERFPDDPFLGFAIKVVADRLRRVLAGASWLIPACSTPRNIVGCAIICIVIPAWPSRRPGAISWNAASKTG